MTPRTTRNPIISFLTNADTLSIQLSKLPLDPSDVKEHIAKFDIVATPSSQIIQSFAKMYHRSQSSGFDIKMKTFGTNTISLFNETTKHIRLDGQVHLVSSKVVPIKTVPQTADRIELITRISVGLINLPNWMLHVDLVKELNNPLEFASKLSSAKKQLVDVPLQTMSQSAYDFVITSLVQIDQEPTTQQQLLDIVDSMNGENVVDMDYQESIFSIAKDIYRDATTISKFKRQSGFKRLCPNPVELNRPLFFKQVLPHINTFYITDKMDGTHAVLVIDEIFRRSGHKRHFLGANIYAVSDRIYEINTFSKPSTSSTIETDHTVLDVEMMEDSKGVKTFHCFDVIAIASQRMVGLPFHKRFEKFPNAQTLLEKYDLGGVKEFIKLDDTYSSQIKSFYDKKRSYHIDGIIFTPAGQFYKEAIKTRTNRFDRIFNTEYSNTISFKWKPLDQLTIDFFFMKDPKKKDGYILCTGIDRKTFEQLKLSFFDGYEPPKTTNSHKYFPIQFETYDGEFEYHWKPSDKDYALLQATEHKTFDALVGEFKFADAKGRLAHPELIRLRIDRAQDIAKGEYYGNALRYAELIWHSIQYPLMIKDMCEATNSGYFAADDTSDWYKPSRSFNSFVKTHLLETYMPAGNNSRIMDIAAGKGQDLARAIDVGYSEIVALDKDTDALSELLDRKYNLRVKTKNSSANIHIKQIDLERSAEENSALLKLPKNSADSAMINFAIHYICHSATVNQKEPLDEFAKLCSLYLKQGGKLMITAFNGADVFEKLKSTSEWTVKDGDRVKYSIKRAFSSDELTNLNQAIDVLLPFSAGNYYREYLVNYEYVQSVFESNGFKLTKTDSFSSLLRAYKKNNNRGYQDMTDGDKQYVSLYGYMIFEKI